MPTTDFTKDAQERALAQVIIPSELSPDELWQRNGEYVPIEFVRQAEQAARERALEEAACLCQDYAYSRSGGGTDEDLWLQKAASAIRALKEQK